MSKSPRNSALVHDWLVTYRGGEKVLDCLMQLEPEAPIYTLFYDKTKMPPQINARDIRSPALLRPFTKVRKALLPLFPLIMQFWPGKKYDFVLSTSSCVAKSTRANTHICYLHSPMRYIWDQEEIYLEPLKKFPFVPHLIRFINIFLRKWDRKTASRVERFICNSSFVAERVKKFYGRESCVIHPPIEDECFDFPRVEKKNQFVAAGALVWYKRFDLAIEACEALGQPLVIAGSGPYIETLRKMAGPMTTIIESPSNDEFRKIIAESQALLFPGIEDFGLIAIEAMALGTPVIAYKDGGALDFINKNTGLYFTKQTRESLMKAVEGFDKNQYSYGDLRTYAGKFRRKEFLSAMQTEIERVMKESK